MSGQGGQPLTSAYVSMSKSKRWARKPIPTGSSDCDDRGGGVSLTAASDFDDEARPSFRYDIPNHNNSNKGKKPAVPPSKLRGNAKPFNANVNTETTSAGSTTSIKANTVHADAARTYTPPQPAAAAPREQVEAATQVLMDMYNKNRERARSITTTTSANGQYTGDASARGGSRGRGHTAAHSSPIKAVTSNTENNATAPSRATIGGDQANAIRYDAQAPVFMPIGNGNNNNNNGFANGQQQGNPVAVDTQYRGTPMHGFATGVGSAHGTPTRSGRGTQHDLNGGRLNANPTAPNDPNAATFMPGIPYKQKQQQQQHGQPFPAGGAGPVYNNQQTDFPAHSVEYHHQYPTQQQQQFPNVMYHQSPISSSSQVQQHQPSQQMIGIPFQTHHYERAGATMPMPTPMTHGNGQQQIDRGHYDPYMNGAPPPPGISWKNNGQSTNMSTALVRSNSEAVVGPIDFEIPDKQTMARRSEMLQALTENGRPSLEDLLDPKFLPFVESYKFSSPSDENGVVVVRNVSLFHSCYPSFNLPSFSLSLSLWWLKANDVTP